MKIKYFILGMFFTIIVALVVNNLVVLNSDDVVIIKQISNFTDEMDNIDKKINKVKRDECRDSLNKMSNNIKKTYFSQDTTVTEYYETYFSDTVFLDLYKEVLNSCELSENNSRYLLALASYSFPSSIKAKYNLKHEVKFRDLETRESVLKDEYEVGSYSSKMLELNVINELLDEVGK